MTATLPRPVGAASPRPATFDAVFDQPGSTRPLALLRIVLGPVVLAHLAPFLADSLRGITYLDRFHTPWLAVLPEVPGTVQVLMIWTGAVAAIALGLGWHTRLVAPITFACVAGNFFLSQTHFRHNRAFLLILLATVALGASGRVLSLDARRRRRQGRVVGESATIWPLWLLRVLVSSVYFASGFSKLIDPDWSGGLVLWDRAVRYQELMREQLPHGPLTDLAVEVVTTRWVHAVTSPIAVAMELFIALGLWSSRTRLAAIWIAIFFHLSIELSASVEVFSLAAVGALVIWITPVTRGRTVTVADGRWIRRLDWFARFEVHDQPGAPLSVTDRDGTRLVGRDARHLVAARLPLTFLVALPAAGLTRLRRVRA
ncbi:MAG: HTTM domain-containing protein [Acidimicrobiales bacterium]